MMVKFNVYNLGCKVNRVESDSITASLLASGGNQVSRKDADVIIVNTCTVTGEADTKTRKAIRQSLAGENNPWVIATGCAIAIDRQGFAALGDRVIAEPDRMQAQVKALELLGLKVGAGDIATSSNASVHLDGSQLRTGKGFNTRMGIKIQDGCDNACSYCIVHVARGHAKSVEPQKILEQVKSAEQAGVREIVLTGVNIGAWSLMNGTHSLAYLLEEILAETSKLRVRISSLEPQHATDDLLQLMASSSGRVCAHLHLPLQSGSDNTLKAMYRSYNIEFFANRIARAKKLMPKIALTTDLIVGFPGESESDFAASLKFCEEMAFSRMHVFRYSKRPGTPAAVMEPQVSPQEKARRAELARECAARMQQTDLAKRVKTSELVLVERDGRGTSESYHPVQLSSEHEVGSLVLLRFIAQRDNLLIAQ